jgi:urease accessory protein
MESTASPTLPDAALLQLIWLASPALPVGGFSYSEGLEAAVEAALVRDEPSAGDWLCDQLHASLARSDLSVLGAAVDAARAGDPERLHQLDQWVRCTRETSELRQQTEQMGRSMGEWQRSLGGGPVGWGDAGTPAMRDSAGVPPSLHRQPTNTQPHFTYPVAFALAAAATHAPTRHIALSFAFGWSENMVQAAVKAVPLGQGAGQRILARLAADRPRSRRCRSGKAPGSASWRGWPPRSRRRSTPPWP